MEEKNVFSIKTIVAIGIGSAVLGQLYLLF